MANKPTQPIFPLGLVADEQSTLAGILNTGTIEHGPDAVLTLPEGNASAGLPSSVRYNADSDEFEGFYENGGWLPLGGGGIRWEALPHASTATLTEGRGYLVDNSTGVSTVVFPSPTRVGDSVTVCDLYGKFSLYPLTIDPNGRPMYGSVEPMTLSTDSVSATFTWSGDARGWIVTAGVGLGQGRVYSRTIFTETVSVDTAQVTLTTQPSIVDVYVDGKRLLESKYSLNGFNVDFSPSIPSGSELQVIQYVPIQLGNGSGGAGGGTVITWIYNSGSAVGGETEIELDVDAEDVSEIFIDGSRQQKGLGFTYDSVTKIITLADELEAGDEVVVVINGDPTLYNQIDRTPNEVARSVNVPNSQVILSSDTVTKLDGKTVIYDVVAQKIWSLPSGIPVGSSVVSVSGSTLTYAPGNVVVSLLPAPVEALGTKVTNIENRLASYNVEYFGFSTGTGQNISNLLTAFNQAEELVFSKGDYYLDDFSMPNTAKCKRIVVKNSRLIMNGYSNVFNVVDTFTIDMTDNGVYHGGLRRATVTADCAVGTYDIPVSDASVFRVGDFVSTSFLIPEPFNEASTPWKWANKLYNANCAFNTIEAINGNVLTMKYPVEQRTLMKNVIIGNWQFSQNGIGFRGTGKVFIKGGKITEPKTRMMHIHNSVQCYIDGTELTNMSIDAIELAHFASLYMNNFRFFGSLDFGKQGIGFTSAGTLSLRNGYWRRGNFDVDIYPGTPSGGAAQLGDVILEGMTFVGTSTLPLTGDQVDSVTGQTANQLFGGRINPARTVYSIDPGAFVSPANGTSLSFVAKNCEFLDYQRGVLKTEFSNNGNIRLRNMVFRDVTATCALFDIAVQSGYTITLAAYELHNLKVERRYTIQYNPLCYIGLDTMLVVTGGITYNDAAISGVDHRVSTNFLYVDTLTIVGGGTPILDQPMFVDRLIVRGSQVTVRPGTQRNVATQLFTIAGGTVTGPLVTKQLNLQYQEFTPYSFVGSSGSWVTIGKSTNSFGMVDVRVVLAPQQVLANTNCVTGTIAARLDKNGTAVPVNYTATNYVSLAAGNLAYWEGHAFGSQGAIADGAVKLRCLADGTIQININTSAGTAGVACLTCN